VGLSGTVFCVVFLLTRLLVFGLFKGEEILAELLKYWLVESGSVLWTSLATT
jgi:hypothetical protein